MMRSVILVATTLWSGVAAASTTSALYSAPRSSGTQARLSGTIYVDCSARAYGDGSLSAPFATLSAINTNILPGTVILFRRGTRCVGQFTTAGSGTADRPIRVGVYGNGTARPVIDGNGVQGADEAGAAFRLVNQEYWEVSGIEVTNPGAARGVRSGIAVILRNFRNSAGPDGKPQGVAHHILLHDVYVRDVAGGLATSGAGSKRSNGIQFRVSGLVLPNWFDGIAVTNSTISNVTREGLTTESVQSCRTIAQCLPNSVAGPPYNQWRPQLHVLFKGNVIENIGGDGIVIRVSKGAVVEGNIGRNLASRDGWESSQISSAGFWTINSDDTVFRFNEVHGTRKLPSNNDGTAFDDDFSNRNTLFEHNYTHDNEGGFILLCGQCGGLRTVTTNGVIRDNISVNDGLVAKRLVFGAGAGEPDFGKAVNGASFYRNSFYRSDDHPIAVIQTESRVLAVRFEDNSCRSEGGLSLARGSGDRANLTWVNNRFLGLANLLLPSLDTSESAEPLTGLRTSAPRLEEASWHDLELGPLTDVVRAAADHHPEHTGLDHVLHLAVPQGEIVGL